jgi:hypothetical protein
MAVVWFALLSASAVATEGPEAEADLATSAVVQGSPDQPAAPNVDADTAVAYADWLLRHSDPFNAITWYRLGLFLEPERPDAGALRFRIGLAYELGARWQAAEVAYGQVADDTLNARAAYRAALALRVSGNGASVDQQLAAVAQFHPGTEWAERATYARGLVYLHDHDLKSARARLAEVPVDGNRWGVTASNLVVALEEPLPSRSPWMAAGLSAVVPGMGKVYAGQSRDGLMSFVVNGLLGAWSYTLLRQGSQDEGRAWQMGMGAVIGGSFALAYSANVVGSWRAAGRFEAQQSRDRAASLLGQLYDPTLELDPRDVPLE